MIWGDPAVQAAVIQSLGAMIAAVIAAIVATMIGRQFADRKRLQENLWLAQGDIAFLLAVEEEHCTLHKQTLQESYKLRMRRAANDRGMAWSGRFTPGRIQAALTQACNQTS